MLDGKSGVWKGSYRIECAIYQIILKIILTFPLQSRGTDY
jgi:hypothetical protein